MIVLVDDREIVADGYSSGFDREGFPTTGFHPSDFREWVKTASQNDLMAVEAFLIGKCENREDYPELIRGRSSAPVIAMNDSQSLENTLKLFEAGVDDVVRKPVHVREILARANAIRRRQQNTQSETEITSDVHVFCDGRDPIVAGEPIALPRRERRILEYLMDNRGRRIGKSQLFSAVYGCFDEDIDECVIESHVSKLRKKLRQRLGYDLIDSKRYLGYSIA